MPEISLKDTLNNAYKKQPLELSDIEIFKSELSKLLESIKENPNESEEHHKNILSSFLKKTWYDPDFNINTHDKVDLVIHNGSKSTSSVGVIIETKKPGKNPEMVSHNNLNVKSMHQLLLYFFREVIDKNNVNIKHLIITNTIEWFIFTASEFYQYFLKDNTLVNAYKDFSTNGLFSKDTSFFYNYIAKVPVENFKNAISYSYINLNDINIDDTENLVLLYKILSPQHLLKRPFTNDNNSLNSNFYYELLYILGLCEEKEEGKKVIVRIPDKKRQAASLLESIIYELSDDVGDEEILFNIALDLVITWINRILFLKLLEAQIIKYNGNNNDYSYLNINIVDNFQELNTLFFKVLAKETANRDASVKDKYKHVPYLNSSLFDKTLTESDYYTIASLKNNQMDVFSSTVLKDEQGNKRKGKISTLEYIFNFLDSYDFSSDDTEIIKSNQKTIINASVLGLIFEKINGYKDGSYFTPGFITSFICSETIKNAIISKFNTVKNWNLKTIIDLDNKIDKVEISEANEIINSIKILDPAVGSGHFLVSALNEIIALKSYLGVLVDKEGRKIKDYKLTVLNDELNIINNDTGKTFIYDYKIEEKQRIQETIFNEKRRIIENCLFGVDINLNSVKICRLRLWIELLKNAYYTKESKFKELETLPNLELNVKSGNSLISRYEIDIDISETIKNLDFTIDEYKRDVQAYKNSTGMKTKRDLNEKIEKIKDNFKAEVKNYDKLYLRRKDIKAELDNLKTQGEMFESDYSGKKEKRIKSLEIELDKLNYTMNEAEQSRIFEDAFEWRIEFPELLDDNGNFTGFDVVIGNPPYIKEYTNRMAFENIKMSHLAKYYQGKMDIWYFFACYGLDLLKQNGILGFIAPNNWTTNAGASILRNKVLQDSTIKNIIDFGSYMVFEEASIQTMIMILEKQKNESYSFDYRKIEIQEPNIDFAHKLINKENEQGLEYLKPTINSIDYINKFLVFGNNETDELLNKIKSKQNFILDEKEEVAQGIVPNPDVVNVRNIEKIPIKRIQSENIKIGDGVFIIGKGTLKGLSQTEKKYIKPVYEPYLIEKYNVNEYDKEIIYITKKNYKKDSPKIPKLIEHLSKYKEIMQDRRENQQGKLAYYHLHWARDKYFFEKGAKILSVRKCALPTFAYTEKEAYVMMSFNVIKSKRIDLKYLTALLNSKLIAFWLKHRGKMQGNMYQVDKEPLLEIPVFDTQDNKIKTKIISYVDKLLELNKELQSTTLENQKEKIRTKIITNEEQINKLVYELYELTEDEVKVVEGK